MAEVELPADPREANTAMQKSDIESQQVEKKPRKRLKKICSQIRQQMEFYFSDANLHKDGFVKQLIDKRDDRYVPISVFSDFNKIRELTTDMKLVAKALSTSGFLEVKEGGEYIRRKTPYTEPKDVDDRTIYVESLPRDVDHDWLRQTFAPYGKVVYISVPRYRTSGDIKGFAFIEFDTKEASEKACQSYQSLDPEDETTARFPKFNKQLQTLQKQISLTGEKVDEKRLKRRSNTSESSTSGENEANPTKRQKRASESSDAGSTEGCSRVAGQEGGPHVTDKGRGRKRSADSGAQDMGHGEGQTGTKKSSSGLDVPTNKENTDQNQDREETKAAETPQLRKRKRSEDSCDKEEADEEKKIKREGEKKDEVTEKGEKGKSEEAQTPTEEPRGVMVDPVKRKRLSDVAEAETGEAREVKRVRISELVDVKENVEVTQKKRRNKKKKKKELREKTEEVTPQIKVIPKLVWLELRKEYLKLQRSSMKALKKSLRNIKKHQSKGVEEGAVPLESYVGASDRPAGPGDQTVGAEKPSAGVEYTPGVIIKIDTDQPCMRKELKETLSLVASVPYVDFQDGDHQGHVRCATPEDALRVITSRPATFRVSLLQAEEEADYWMKINADRDQKRAAKTRSKKRGTQKLMDRAEKTTISGAPKKHIVFDD